MATCSRRLGSGAVATDRPIRVGQQPRPAEISSFPRNFAGGHRIVVLRTAPKHWQRLVWAVRDGGGAWERSEGTREGEKVRPCSYAVDDQMAGDLVTATSSGSEYRTAQERRSVNRTVEVMVAAAIAVVMGVGNRVLYKLALVPLKHYPFFLAQLATIGYFYTALLFLFFFFFSTVN